MEKLSSSQSDATRSNPEGFWKTLYLDLHAKSRLEFAYLVLLRQSGLATFLFRASTYFYPKGKVGWAVGMVFWRLNLLLNSCEFFPNVKIGPGLWMPHPIGLVISGNIGRNVAIFQHVTIGQNPAHGFKMPTIGDNVVIYAGAVIVGDIKIGSGSVIGANTVVTKDVPENSVVTASFAEIRPKQVA